MIAKVPRRCVNLPPGSLRTLLQCALSGTVLEGDSVHVFYREFGRWVGAPHVFGTGSGRSAFQLALQALDLKQGAEIIFPVLTFPVIPMVAKVLGYEPVFCDVDPVTYNAGPEHIEPKISPRTGAVLATHLFGRPCPIREIVKLARQHDIRVMEDCAHACGVRIEGQQAGTFGDIGIFSFAEGKNMPCFGGGAVVTRDDDIARRAEVILAEAQLPDKRATLRHAASIWLMWLLTRPLVFGLSVYPLLRLKLLLNQPLLDSKVGDELLEDFAKRLPAIKRFANLQAAIGLLQLKHVDAFNQGARQNAQALTEQLGKMDGVGVPAGNQQDHIYVYYPLTIAPAQRDMLRHHLLRRGIDSKKTDMANCALLKPFRKDDGDARAETLTEASLLEICVYPVVPRERMGDIAHAIRTWVENTPKTARPEDTSEENEPVGTV